MKMTECKKQKQDGSCPVEKNREGHDICTITGMCIKMLSFSNDEFVDTACVLSSSGRDGAAEEEHEGMDDEDNEEEFNGSRSCCWNTGNNSHEGNDESEFSTSCAPTRHRNIIGQGAFMVDKTIKKLPSTSKKTPSLSCKMSSSCASSLPLWGSNNNNNKQQQQALLLLRSSNGSNNVCSVNKKNRYRSWVYHRVMHNHHNHHHAKQQKSR